MQPGPDPGVPLAHYRRHKAGISLTCLGCMQHRTFDLETVIGRLRARGAGDERTGIKALAQLVRAPCPRCGAENFDSRPHFPTRPKGPGW